ncbi:MAG TPA: LysM domain-containing protein, partial [Phototrophicaceae bacterium]|nr:LysM domain-containing protein [Phototrophicaceae bacterium]
MIRAMLARLPMLFLMTVSFVIGGLIFSRMQNPLPSEQINLTQIAQVTEPPTLTLTPSETFPPTTLLATITPPPPTNTLRPPPTFEPPTEIPSPTITPSETATEALAVVITIPGLQGLETPTSTGTPGCEPRKDWKLIYEVQPNDAIATIAERYGTWTQELAEGNCLTDPNMIVIGQKLHVPGETHPATPQYDCSWQLLAPMDYAYDIDGNGTMSFSWIGPRSPRNLIRVYRNNDTSKIIWEKTIDLRQNETVNLAEIIPEGGDYM